MKKRMGEAMESVEQRILEAAIACIEEVGIHNLTVRRVAVRAEVNTAAINYYFRTKEQLLDRVIETTLANAFDWSDLEYTDALPPKEQLLAITEHLAAGARRYPRITRAHFFEPMVNGNYDTRAVRALNGFLEILLGKLKAKGCRMEDGNLRTALTQIFMAGMFSLGVVPNLCAGFLGEDLTDDGARSAYLRSLIDRLITE